ncbi:polysaccharide deacetylase family protein [Pimelobacter simplex]|uniref:Polysaccharide deacetylase family protein n=1 Tax=Nocardioides simplex TaxID=2045 RepID=A0A7J5E410_NOCSI|nr:polysaccharide deacetylase family protein [Pimelobacter simplex]KAB2813006.1 polysaccharide deacetylase family protein [Pimelobacter simplex]
MRHSTPRRRCAGLLVPWLLVCVAALAACNADAARPAPRDRHAEPEVETRSLSSNDPRFHASWPHVRDAHRLSKTLDRYVKTTVDEFAAEYGDTHGGTAAPELNIAWRLVADDDKVVGVRLESYLFAGANGETAGRTWWYDRTSGRLRANAGLVRGTAALEAAVLAAVADPDVDPALVSSSLRQGAPDVDFTDDGRLRVRFAQYDVAPGSSGVVAVVLDDAATEALLSPYGKRARAAAVGQKPVGEDLPSVPPATATTPTPPTPPTPPATAGTPGTTPGATGKGRAPVNCRKVKCVALTFDDGPVSDTNRLLRVLRRADAPATFFVLGQQVQTYPETLARVARQGHEIGIHTWDHRQLTTLRPRKIRGELVRSQLLVEQVTGHKPTLFRPPYGASDARVLRIARSLGLAQVLWSVDTLDWKNRAVRPILAKVRSGARPGRIILMHDIHRTSVDAVPRVIKLLRRKGYHLVTVSELLGTPQAGRSYSQR